ncbi:hypothetical protein [Pseudomonas baetica]|uniref:hypothetical protein n=1 Tax=Pseudomonas baetica TaxID=674054 RepID=UPI002405B569|nr:hypothetical protein [Pseudomonas baetica]MDF9778876.1 hypothetical protein [Pseudomonas baetica]
MKMIVALSAVLLLPSAAMAEESRLAGGKPCYPTEKTYFDKDGITPHTCVPNGGPAYNFKVFDGNKLIWEGALPSSKPEVTYDFPQRSVVEKSKAPRLVVKRDLSADPMGKVVFFGEEHLRSIDDVQIGSNKNQIPKIQSTGISIPVGESEVITRMGKIEGAAVDFKNYRISVSPVI